MENNETALTIQRLLSRINELENFITDLRSDTEEFLKQVSTRTAKREYHKKWRAEHPDSVKSAQIKYWAKKEKEGC